MIFYIIFNQYMLTQNEILIVSKYFENINDYINVTKCCKEYKDILNLLHFNSIPLNKNIYKFFPNIQTYHIYNKKHFKNFDNYNNISKIIWYPVYFDMYIRLKKLNVSCKYIKLNKNNINIYRTKYKNKIIEFGKNCFEDCLSLTNITIPNSITKIDNHCF